MCVHVRGCVCTKRTTSFVISHVYSSSAEVKEEADASDVTVEPAKVINTYTALMLS